MRRTVFAMLAWSACVLAGCSHQNCDLLEAELRTREDKLYELQAQLQQAQGCNQALQQELMALRQSPACKITPELASQLYTLKDIALGRLTGGIDEDNCPGDEALQVVVEPRDCDGQSIKAPGALHVTALQISARGTKSPLSSWDVDPNQLRKSWRGGLFGSGYYVVLPWKIWPTSPTLRVVARLQLTDGRIFEAEKDVTVHLTAPGPGKPFFMEPPPLVPDAEILLPGPHTFTAPGPDLGRKPTALPWQVAKESPLVEMLKPRPIPAP